MSNHTPEAMTAAQALDHLERIKAVTPRKMDAVLSVEVYAPGSIGGPPTVPVVGLGLGFDWSDGKLIIRTDKQLTTLTQEQADAILESVRKGNSWHAYERYKQHKAREKELSDQLATVTAQRDELLKDLKEMERLIDKPECSGLDRPTDFAISHDRGMRIASIQSAIKKSIAKCEVKNDA